MRFILVTISIIFMASSPAFAGKKPTKEEKRQAYEAKMLKKSFLDIEEMAKNNKQAAGYIAYLKKKGITNSAHFEQYKVRIRVEGMRKYRPRRWSETGHSDTRVDDPRKEKKLDYSDPRLPEAKERW